MNIYTRKQQWKLWLVLAALFIIGASLWFGNVVVKQIAADEKNKVRIWAEAIANKVALVNYTEELFNKMKEEERKKVELWASANHKLHTESNSNDLTFYLDIIRSNKTIPTILTDKNDIVTSSINLDFVLENNQKLPDSIKQVFSKYEPIEFKYRKETLSIIYYKDSRLFSELQDVLNNLIQTFITEVVVNSSSVPVIITDSTHRNLVSCGNIDSLIIQDTVLLFQKIHAMESGNKPIEVVWYEGHKNYIYYENSFLLTQLKYYPYIQFAIIGLFLFIAYLGFSNTRKAEQNQVWVGMARETAHQLGTPLSSLIAWVEYMQAKEIEPATTRELEKDIQRLETITERFSKIGSEPKLVKDNIIAVIIGSVDYIKSRTSSKVEFIIHNPDNVVNAPVNVPLFDWVIENLCKNAVDAMEGSGRIDILITDMIKHVYVDVTDTGKGVPKSQFRNVFKPGFTTKTRGWGLGLSLSKRIIENYHNGKIFVKQSVVGKGTTFRIVLGK
ncbi:MAG: hypothetical protein KKA07_01865 [Bacteroidetes bacterium]|nr:hypothetical protein [Bacteroidota bacterium]MBU1717797.1 hypothetical protein [Bacteroidota bacterium]